MNDRYDVVIIGAGVIGAAIAFEMAKKGTMDVSHVNLGFP